MQSSTPNGQLSHPNHSVHALKPLIKIVSFGPLARKPAGTPRQYRTQAWSIDLKYRCLGLIGADIADSEKSGGSGLGGRLEGIFRPKRGGLSPASGRYRGLSAAAACGACAHRD